MSTGPNDGVAEVPDVLPAAPVASCLSCPVTGGEFEALMAAVGPFETRPRIAVAVSGGADSLALALLVRDWGAANGGECVALTVDHQLRPESAAEARKVAGWLAAQGIRHRILRWRGPRPKSGLQDAARQARYRLLSAWCRQHGVLHLAVAHQMEDQAETLLLRLIRGSGLDGLAAMAAVGETRGEAAGVRLIRPLLPVGRDRLRRTLMAHGQAWIEDPSNRDPAHLRARLRMLLPALTSSLAPAGLTAHRLADTARQLGRARAALDDMVAALLAHAVALFPAGYARLDTGILADAPREASLRALSRVLLAVGGGTYTPRLERLERLHGVLIGAEPPPPRTLAGCRLSCHRGVVLVCREAAKVVDEVRVSPGARLHWDGRFVVAFARTRSRPVPSRAEARIARDGTSGRREPAALLLRRLGADGWRQIAAAAPGLRGSAIPAAVRPTLPALWRSGRVVAVPHLGYRSEDGEADPAIVRLDYAPAQALATARFTVA